MTAVKPRKKKQPADKFAQDQIGGEYEKPGPKMDPDAAGIAAVLSKISKREQTGVVLNWRPQWLPQNVGKPFSFYFNEDKLAVDTFSRDVAELDALTDDFSQEERQEIAAKTVLCQEQGVAYLTLGPDDDLDPVKVAAKIQKVSFKKGQRPQRTEEHDGIREEGNDEF